MATEVLVKKWGSSLGVVLPKELVKKENLKENEKILVDVVKEANLGALFKSVKRKMSGQRFKDVARRGWGT